MYGHTLVQQNLWAREYAMDTSDFTLNTGATIPRVGLGTWQAEVCALCCLRAAPRQSPHRNRVESIGAGAPLQTD